MHFTIYRITNRKNSKIYIGKHQTENLDDGYMGSGKYLKRAIAKYGIESFTKEILHIFKTEDEMNAKERELVTEEFCARKDTYNICEGGKGGFGYLNSTGKNIYENHSATASMNAKKGHATVQKKRLIDPEYNKKYIERQGKSSAKAWKKAMELYPNGIWFGKSHSDDTKKKIGEINAVLQLGSGNSQFGTMWITDGQMNKKLKKDHPIPEGWRKGRV